ncbi:hypothetical protein EWM64_g4823 [Hericium alpestre]|uniref:Uncharacterized protein n=1 Tax=Hericium alpestre TaxID=135208 RepID=A0A4Y9ZWJ5_9AGAM|nr:hypothetical protein EWM64_g4823 [Hericium alpestre]
MRARFTPQARTAMQKHTPRVMKSHGATTKGQFFGFLAHFLNIFLVLSPWFLTSFMLAYPFFDHRRSLQSSLEYKAIKPATGVSVPFYDGIDIMYRAITFILAVPSGLVLHTHVCRPIRNTFMVTTLRGHKDQLWWISVAILKALWFSVRMIVVLVIVLVGSLIKIVREDQRKRTQTQTNAPRPRVRFAVEKDDAPTLGQVHAIPIHKPFPSKTAIRIFENKPWPSALPMGGSYCRTEKQPNHSRLSSSPRCDRIAEHRERKTGRPLVAPPSRRTNLEYCKLVLPDDWQPDLEHYLRMNRRSAEKSSKLSTSSPKSEPKSASGLADKVQPELENKGRTMTKAKVPFVPVKPAKPKYCGDFSFAQGLLEMERQSKTAVDIQVDPKMANEERGTEGDKKLVVSINEFSASTDAFSKTEPEGNTFIDVQATKPDEDPVASALAELPSNVEPWQAPIMKHYVPEDGQAVTKTVDESDSSADDEDDLDSLNDTTLLGGSGCGSPIPLIVISKENFDCESDDTSKRIPALEKGKSPIRSFVPAAENPVTGPEVAPAVIFQEKPAVMAPIPIPSPEILVPLQAPLSSLPVSPTPDEDIPMPLDPDIARMTLFAALGHNAPTDDANMNWEGTGPAIEVHPLPRIEVCPPPVMVNLPSIQDLGLNVPHIQGPIMPMVCAPPPIQQLTMPMVCDPVVDAPIVDMEDDTIEVAPIIQPQSAMKICAEPQAPVPPVPSIVPPKVLSVNPPPYTNPSAPQKAPAGMGFAAKVMLQREGSTASYSQRVLEEFNKTPSPLRNELPQSRTPPKDNPPTSSPPKSTGSKQTAPGEKVPVGFCQSTSSLRNAARQSRSSSTPSSTSSSDHARRERELYTPKSRVAFYKAARQSRSSPTPSSTSSSDRARRERELWTPKSKSTLSKAARQSDRYSLPRDKSAPQLRRSKQTPGPPAKGTGPPRNAPVQSSLSKPPAADPPRPPAVRQLRHEERVYVDPALLRPTEPVIKMVDLPRDAAPGTSVTQKLKDLGTGPMAVSW